MNQVNKQKSFPEVPNEAIAQPEQERHKKIDPMPDQVDNEDEVEYKLRFR